MKHIKLFENYKMINEVDEIRHYPESGLHPLVQSAIFKAFEDLAKKYPGLTDMDCKKDEHNIRRLHYKYKGKQMSTVLNLTGDTYTKVMQDVKRRIDPPKKTHARFINTSGYRY